MTTRKDKPILAPYTITQEGDETVVRFKFGECTGKPSKSGLTHLLSTAQKVPVMTPAGGIVGNWNFWKA